MTSIYMLSQWWRQFICFHSGDVNLYALTVVTSIYMLSQWWRQFICSHSGDVNLYALTVVTSICMLSQWWRQFLYYSEMSHGLTGWPVFDFPTARSDLEILGPHYPETRVHFSEIYRTSASSLAYLPVIKLSRPFRFFCGPTEWSVIILYTIE